MRRTLAAIAFGATILSVGAAGTFAADLGGGGPPVVEGTPGPVPIERTSDGCRLVRTCTAVGCGWRRSCPHSCPDRFSCSPLYGAYGPYGGTRYWGAYTYSGWGYRY
jgi:hypothetical protein